MTSRGGDQLNVLYVVGLYRSGSTIFDIILGNHEDVVSVGELRSLPLVGWDGNEQCSCGVDVANCPFWTAVRSEWNASVGGDKARRLAELVERFERLRWAPAHLASWVLGPRATLREYGELTAKLFEAIARVSGKNIIVDSTKYPGRALALLRTGRVRVHLIHLVRDGRAVIWSCHRKPNVDLQGRESGLPTEEVARITTRRWFWINLFSSAAVALGRPRGIRIRYEDLVSDPKAVLGRVGEMVGIDFGPLVDKLERGDPIGVGHMVAGNRVRHQSGIRLRPDLEWQEKLPAADRDVFWQKAGWLATRYGYSK